MTSIARLPNRRVNRALRRDAGAGLGTDAPRHFSSTAFLTVSLEKKMEVRIYRGIVSIAPPSVLLEKKLRPLGDRR